MAKKGFFILFGPPGGGKSTAALQCFQDAFVLQNAPNNAHFYEQWLSSEGRGSGKRPPARVITLDRFVLSDSGMPGAPPSVNVSPTPLPQKYWFETIMTGVVNGALQRAAQRQAQQYRNIIIDESGTFWTRIFEEIQPTVRNREGKLDPLGAFNVGATWSRQLTDWARQVTNFGLNVCMIAHDREPDPTKDKQGGPKFFSEGVMKQLCADADGVIMRELRDPQLSADSLMADPAIVQAQIVANKDKASERLWRVHGSEKWAAKLRGLSDSRFGEIRRMELEHILPLAGFEP